MAETQQQFDWHKESSKCVEGLRLAVGEDLEFELDYDNVELKQALKKDSSGNKIPSLNNDGTPKKIWSIPVIEVQSKITKYLTDEKGYSFWANANVRVNPNTPEVEDAIVRLSRRLGYNPQLGGDFVPEDFLKRGLRFVAQLVEYQDEKDPTKKYTRIDMNTIRLADGSGPSDSQAPLADDSELISEVLTIAEDAKLKKFSDLVAKINKAKRTKDLLPVAMKMKTDGVLPEHLTK